MLELISFTEKNWNKEAQFTEIICTRAPFIHNSGADNQTNCAFYD